MIYTTGTEPHYLIKELVLFFKNLLIVPSLRTLRCLAKQSPSKAFHRLPGDTPELDNNLRHGEIITSIDLPANGFAQNYSYLKIRDRNSYAFALVSVATGLGLDGEAIKEARIALGGVAHKPWRIKEVEDYLKDKKAEAENFAAAANIILQGAEGYIPEFGIRSK